MTFIFPAEPSALFEAWFAEAKNTEPCYPEAMTLATVGADHRPSSRVVLMKSYDHRGIVFHTNRASRKGHEIGVNPLATLCFFWKSLSRQIRIEGQVEPVTEVESDAYFLTRPRDSQIGAWASQQSRVLDSRATLEQRIEEYTHKFKGIDVPRPPHWGGYRLIPDYYEFWHEQPFRLHDRIVYKREDDDWLQERLYP